MSQTSASASASSSISSPPCSATSPSTVSLQGHAQPQPRSKLCSVTWVVSSRRSLSTQPRRSSELRAAAQLRHVSGSGHHGDGGATGHPALCGADGAAHTLPCE